MVGNFHKGFVFTFFTSPEPFAKIKSMLSTSSMSKPCFNPAYSNYLVVLTPTEACQQVCLWQLSLKPSRNRSAA